MNLNAKQSLFVTSGQSHEKVIGPVAYEGGFAVVYVSEAQAAGPKTLQVCRGQVITDLQKALEDQWLDYLGHTYPADVDHSVWMNIQKEL